MAILKVANIHFNASGTDRIEWRNATDNVLRFEIGALKLPIGDTTSRPGGVPGLIRYNTTTGTLEGYNATSWGTITGTPEFATGTRALFKQTTAPTGWTKDTVNYNNHAIRVVTGTATSGGTVDFTTAFALKSVTGSVSISGSGGNATLSTPQIASHSHLTGGPPSATGGAYNAAESRTDRSPTTTGTITSDSAGGGSSHNHPSSISASFTGTSIDLSVRYLDVITATKD